jgi:polyphosphate kinase
MVDDIDLPALKFPVYSPPSRPELVGENLFSVLKRQDVLLHHPYESFAPVVEFICSVATDPNVIAIRWTVYRTGSDSKLMEALINAARAGKEVTVVVELMARFDEETNSNWALRLEEVGAHVVYGVVGHKTHAKMTLLLRREHGKIQSYAHMGTGNYHTKTARIYEDFGLLTSNPDICKDVAEIFRRLTGLGKSTRLRQLLQAPFTLAETLIHAIRTEAQNAKDGKKAMIAIKVNTLVDAAIIKELCLASQAGVNIELIVRGVCALKAGVIGSSETIKVRSVVGRFLEHSRVYYFYADGAESLWLGSADWMERNFQRRVETAVPILDPKLKRRVFKRAFSVHLRDNCMAWMMRANGEYQKARLGNRRRFCSQEELLLTSSSTD